jgi:hypothetical protein
MVVSSFPVAKRFLRQSSPHHPIFDTIITDFGEKINSFFQYFNTL